MMKAQQLVNALGSLDLKTREQYPGVGWIVDARGNHMGTLLRAVAGGTTVTIDLKEQLDAVLHLRARPQVQLDMFRLPVAQG